MLLVSADQSSVDHQDGTAIGCPVASRCLLFWEHLQQHFHDDLNDAVAAKWRQRNDLRCGGEANSNHRGSCGFHVVDAVD